MSCSPQRTLGNYFLGIPIPAPSGKRLLSHLSPMDISEALIVWFQLIRQRGKASIEDVYEDMDAEPEVRQFAGRAYSPFGPEVESRFQRLNRQRGTNIVKLEEVPSRRPSRRGACVGVWGVRRE